VGWVELLEFKFCRWHSIAMPIMVLLFQGLINTFQVTSVHPFELIKGNAFVMQLIE
jgi:hypothetical protein